MISIAEVTGLIAGSCTTFAFIPQITKLWCTRSTQDISLFMYLIFCAGLILWIVHGVYINSVPLIIANVITLILGLNVIAMKILWEKKVG